MTVHRRVTDFADRAFLLPLFALTGAAITLAGRWRTTLVWVGVIGATLLAAVLVPHGVQLPVQDVAAWLAPAPGCVA